MDDGEERLVRLPDGSAADLLDLPVIELIVRTGNLNAKARAVRDAIIADVVSSIEDERTSSVLPIDRMHALNVYLEGEIAQRLRGHSALFWLSLYREIMRINPVESFTDRSDYTRQTRYTELAIVKHASSDASITEDPERTRRSVYTIADPHFAFYFRFIHPNRGRIDRGFGRQVVDDIILPNLDSYIGHIFEDIARDYVRELMNRNELPGVDVGAWWSTDGKHEIDIVGVAANRRPTFAGSVKWRDAELGKAVLTSLDDGIAAMKADPSLLRLLVGRRGASTAIQRSGVRSISLTDLYAESS